MVALEANRRVQHLGDGRWWDEEDQIWRNGRGRSLPRLALVNDTIAVRTTKVVLATAHLDHDPTNNRPRNLKALCQRCHMIHDHAGSHCGCGKQSETCFLVFIARSL